MEFFAGYGFNKSHSAAYALIAYWTAFFKANYPQAFMAALLTSVMGNADKVRVYIEECRRLGIPIFPPDVNHSKERFTVEGDGIRVGLLAVKNLGSAAIQAIRKEQAKAPFTSLHDFCRRVDLRTVNKRAVEELVRVGLCIDRTYPPVDAGPTGRCFRNSPPVCGATGERAVIPF